ncbi:hypothetical protein [Micromonospora sp. SH-82]|uniref:hypothetical protein n=1 Tax=Micromonospora sp. SH-82 TaxID=3132938 RepID=UPI003EB97633
MGFLFAKVLLPDFGSIWPTSITDGNQGLAGSLVWPGNGSARWGQRDAIERAEVAVKIEQWTGRSASLLQQAAGMTNEGFAEWLGVSVRTVAYWRSRPATILGRANQEILATALGRISDVVSRRFWNLAGESHDSLEEFPAEGGVGRLLAKAAEFMSEDRLLASCSVSVESRDLLQEEVDSLARCGGMSASETFGVAYEICENARALAYSSRRPRELVDLYLILAQSVGLMASSAFDLGFWRESATLARASTQYADLAGHASMKAWTYGLRMTLHNWRNEPGVALDLLAKALIGAPEGESKFRLHHIAARSRAILGDSVGVAEMLSHARRDRDVAAGGPDDLGEFGGEFSFGVARAEACAAAAWLDVSEGKKAAKCTSEALRLYRNMPEVRRPYSQVAGTQIDLGAACLLTGDRDAAVSALRSILDLPQQKRNTSLVGRMSKVSHILAAPQWRKDAVAGQVAEEVSLWLSGASRSRT